MKIFGFRILNNSAYRKMQADLRGAICNVEEAKRKNEMLKAELDAIKNGKRCSGEYCRCCKSYGGTRMTYSVLGFADQVPVCLKEVPCPEFERKDEKV